MTESGLQAVRQWMNDGFFYDNLLKMARGCLEDAEPDKSLTAYVVHGILTDIIHDLGDKPVLVETTRRLEAKYRTAINLALEEALAASPPERQIERLKSLIHIHWDIRKAS